MLTIDFRFREPAILL